jgi:hypothetical protein
LFCVAVLPKFSAGAGMPLIGMLCAGIIGTALTSVQTRKCVNSLLEFLQLRGIYVIRRSICYLK